MPTCRKCNNDFPNLVIIENKTRNLGNRKFCLDCSPFGGRNTKQDDPSRPAVCGQKDKKRVPYSKWPEKSKELWRKRNHARGNRRKKQLVDMYGGKCKECGYNKCFRSLSFHHREPALKKFKLDLRSLRGKSWSSLLEEAAKCDLLCLNCHMELEDEIGRSRYLD
jgi:hypothetical protein